jgi:uncharacterized protein
MADITPPVPEARQIVQGYGDGRFRIAGLVHEGSVIVFPDRTVAWAAATIEEASESSLAAVFARADEIDILLLGCGRAMSPAVPGLRAALRRVKIAVEPMDTGAACRTFNVLVAEERRVAAALIAVR